jgi:maltase-glucoamylase
MAEEHEKNLQRSMATPEWQANPSWNYSGLEPQDPRWPPFLPGRTGGVTDLEEKTLAMSARQAYPLNSQVTTTPHYNVHNLYGWSEGIATIAAMESIRNKRGMVIGRSTFATSGRYQGHWLGDNNSDWPDLYFSLVGIMTFNMFGMPLVGSDVCGFGYSRDTNQPTTAELCNRWMQAAAWTAPFYRNHNTIGKAPQEPSVWPEPYKSNMRNALNDRLSIVPYLYTQMHYAHSNATPVAMPLFVPFYQDENVAAIDTQVMLGPALMVSPVITQGATSRSVYFPQAGAPWYHWRTGGVISSNGGYQNIPADLGTIPVHVRSGYIVPQQLPNMTTVKTALNPFNLTVALPGNAGAIATGSIFLDDGDSLLSYETGLYSLIEWQAAATSADGSSGTLTGRAVQNGYTPPSTATLQAFRILGVKRWNSSGGSKVTVNGQLLANVAYDATNQVLTVSGGFAVPLTSNLDVAWASSR